MEITVQEVKCHMERGVSENRLQKKRLGKILH